MTRADYSGVWLSRYEYSSGERDATFTGEHQVVVEHRGDRLTVRSAPGSASTLTIALTVDGPVATGTWDERTDPEGHYAGARYHGAIQLVADSTGRRMTGMWVGFGKDMVVNTGPWELVFQGATNEAGGTPW